MTSMLRKKEVFTVVTPIPGFIPRQLALDILHSHSEVITLNPLVIGHKPIPAPRNAAADEFYSTWYEIEERIQYVPGVGKLGSGKISFNGCFHDMPWGLQTHIYAPLNIDLRNKYRIAGNVPGHEEPEIREIGLEKLGLPAEGLYLREDIEIKCNVAMVSFVKAQQKAAGKEMVQRIIKKAELLDAGVLQAMLKDGKLKTINPNDRSTLNSNYDDSQYAQNFIPQSPTLPNAGQVPPLYSPSHPPAPYNHTGSTPSPQPGLQPAPLRTNSARNSYQQAYGQAPPPIPPKSQEIIMELPGDFVHPQASPSFQNSSGNPSPDLNRYSYNTSDPRWSQQTYPNANPHRMSVSSVGSIGRNGYAGRYSNGLAAAQQETREKYRMYAQN